MEPDDSPGPSKIHHLALKAIGSVFGLIIAPIIVVLGANLLQKKIEEPGADASKTVVAAKDEAKDAAPAKAAAPVAEVKHQAARVARKGIAKGAFAKTPTSRKQGPSTIRLFNGSDLAGFYSYIGPSEEGGEPLGKNKESGPGKVFSVRGGELHVSGKRIGALITDDEYENYHLTVEYKWGEHTYYNTKQGHHPRRSGIILHGTGEDGSVRGAWLPGVQVEVVERHAGDLFLFLRAPKKVSLMVEADEVVHDQGKNKRTAHVYRPGAPASHFAAGPILRLGSKPFQSQADAANTVELYEKPHGEWNTVECVCEGDSIVVLVNGKQVNAATKVSVSRGKILFLSQGAEIFFRNIELNQL